MLLTSGLRALPVLMVRRSGSGWKRSCVGSRRSRRLVGSASRMIAQVEPLEDRSLLTFGAVVELSGLDGTNGFQISGEAVNNYSGGSVSGAGDINGDGIADLIIGAYRVEHVENVLHVHNTTAHPRPRDAADGRRENDASPHSERVTKCIPQ